MWEATGSEVLLLARTLLAYPKDNRTTVARQILGEVETAALHLQDTGRCHPVFGDGSIMARCHRLSPRPEPPAQDPDFLAALIAACETLMGHSGH